jgi:PAS domain S-box-containing protein
MVAGWWQADRSATRQIRELLDDAERCAVAFNVDETHALAGSPSDLTNPAYVTTKARLARLRQISPSVRSVCLLRLLPETEAIVLLADSEPPDSRKIANPGDVYGDAARRTRLRRLFLRGLPAAEGPLGGASVASIVAYAAIGGASTAPRELIALELAADHWRRDWISAAVQAAVVACLILGLPFGLWLAVRRRVEQTDTIRKLSHAVEQSRSAVVITGVDRRIEFVNAGLCAITGWRREDLLGQPVRMLASSETTDDQHREILEVVRVGRTWVGETTNRRRDGSTYPARCVISPVYDAAGRLTHIIAAIEDITERRQGEAALVYARERAEAGERAKGQFLATMSHEIRTPLNGIIGFADLLLDSPLNPEQRECAVTIRDSGEALVQLTSNVLDYSKIDAGRLTLEPEPCSPLECVESVLETFAGQAAENGIELLHWVDDDVPEAVLADAGRLRQVLANLLGNAVKFTMAGEVEITVRREAPRDHGGAAPGGQRPGSGTVLAFAVRDTGVGISQTERGKLFKPFSPIDSSSTRRYGGAGLGLAISRSLVQMMGGEIRVESEMGRGSTFTFTITAGEVPPGSRPPLPPDHDALCGRTLALVTASAPLGGELGRLAGRWGARVLACGRDELAAVAWDAALVDLAAAEVDAWLQLFSQRPELSSRPVLALIPFDLPVTKRDALQGNFRALLRKPAGHHALHGLLATGLHAMGTSASGAGAPAAANLDLRVLLVQDNPVDQRLTEKMLEVLGCHWDLADESQLALSRLERGSYDVVMLDLNMAEVDGLTVGEHIRRGGAGEANRAIWVITLAPEEAAGHRQVSAGVGSDCLVKPLKRGELEAALRRSRGRIAAPG